MSYLSRLRGLLQPLQSDGASPSRIPTQFDFWRLWVVGLVQFMVRWIETIAFAVFIYQSTASAFLVAMITMLRMLPMGLFGVLFGALADRIERRTSLLIIVTTSLMTSCVLLSLALAGQLAIWHLAVASFVNGVGWAADNPVRRFMIGDIVGVDRIGTAMAIDVGSNIGSRLAGPTLGGFLLATTGLSGAFVLCIGLYLISFAAAFGIRYRNAAPPAPARMILRNLMDGLYLVLRDQRLCGILIVTIIFNIFGWPTTSMIAVIGQDNLELGAKGIGLLASVEGVGAMIGAIAIGMFATPSRYGIIYVGGTIMLMATICLFALAPNVGLAGVAIFLVGFGNSGFTILQATLVYLSVSPDMRGRALGLLATCIGIGPLGFLLVGLLAEAVGATSATILTGATGIAVTLATRRYWRSVVYHREAATT